MYTQDYDTWVYLKITDAWEWQSNDEHICCFKMFKPSLMLLYSIFRQTQLASSLD